MSSVRNIFKSLSIIGKSFCTDAKVNLAKKTSSEVKINSAQTPSKPIKPVRFPQPIIVTPEIEKSFGKPIDKEILDQYLEELENVRRTMSAY